MNIDQPESQRERRRRLDNLRMDRKYPNRCSICGLRLKKQHRHAQPKHHNTFLSLLRDVGSFNVLVLYATGDEYEVDHRLFDENVDEATARAAMEREV